MTYRIDIASLWSIPHPLDNLDPMAGILGLGKAPGLGLGIRSHFGGEVA
jgi:hypothetical protein